MILQASLPGAIFTSKSFHNRYLKRVGKLGERHLSNRQPMIVLFDHILQTGAVYD